MRANLLPRIELEPTTLARVLMVLALNLKDFRMDGQIVMTIDHETLCDARFVAMDIFLNVRRWLASIVVIEDDSLCFQAVAYMTRVRTAVEQVSRDVSSADEKVERLAESTRAVADVLGELTGIVIPFPAGSHQKRVSDGI